MVIRATPQSLSYSLACTIVDAGGGYYADFVTNAHQWERLVMTDTISPLRVAGSTSWKLIERWLAEG